MEKPRKVIDSFCVKKHLTGGFYIVEIFHYSNEKGLRKRKLKNYRNLTMSEADVILYKLEKKIKK